VLFDPIELHNGQSIEAIGELTQYKGEFELIADEIIS